MAPCLSEAQRQTLNANIIFLLNKWWATRGAHCCWPDWPAVPRIFPTPLLAASLPGWLWLICTSHKKFNFISPFLISYSADRYVAQCIRRKQSTLDNNYKTGLGLGPGPGPREWPPELGPRRPISTQKSAKQCWWKKLMLFSISFFQFWPTERAGKTNSK